MRSVVVFLLHAARARMTPWRSVQVEKVRIRLSTASIQHILCIHAHGRTHKSTLSMGSRMAMLCSARSSWNENRGEGFHLALLTRLARLIFPVNEFQFWLRLAAQRSFAWVTGRALRVQRSIIYKSRGYRASARATRIHKNR